MDHIQILSRALRITWRYKALWLFGFLLALVSGGGGGGSGGGGGPVQWVESGPPDLPSVEWGTIMIIIALVAAVIILLGVIMTILRYVAETALIAGVDEIESEEAAFTIRRGFRLGWSRSAWRMFLADLIIHLPIIAVLLGLVVLGLLLFMQLASDQAEIPRALPIVGVLLTLLCAALPILVFSLVISLFRPYIMRRAVLGGQGAFASIRQGISLVRASLLDTGLMWLLLAGIGIVWGLVMMPLAFLLAALALFIGGVPAAAVYAITGSVVLAAILGIPLFLIVFVPPISFIQGLFEVYLSTTWTLTYRQIAALHLSMLPVSAEY